MEFITGMAFALLLFFSTTHGVFLAYRSAISMSKLLEIRSKVFKQHCPYIGLSVSSLAIPTTVACSEHHISCHLHRTCLPVLMEMQGEKGVIGREWWPCCQVQILR